MSVMDICCFMKFYCLVELFGYLMSVMELPVCYLDIC